MLNFLKKLVPQSIKNPIIRDKIYSNEKKEDQLLMDKKLKLEEKHIQNLRTVTNRIEFLKKLPKGGVVCEIGVAEGYFSEEILKTCKPTKLYLVDLWESNNDSYSEKSLLNIQKRFAKEITAGVVEIKRGWSYEQVEKLSNNSLDWAYVDAGHKYHEVKKDLDCLLPKMKDGGIICGHDYVRWSGPLSRFGIVEAVNEFCLNHDFEFLYMTAEQNRNLSYAIRKIGK